MMSDFSKTNASLQYINFCKLSVGGRIRDSRMSRPVSLFTVCHLHWSFFLCEGRNRSLGAKMHKHNAGSAQGHWSTLSNNILHLGRGSNLFGHMLCEKMGGKHFFCKKTVGTKTVLAKLYEKKR